MTIVTPFVIIAALVTISIGFYHGCKLMAMIEEIEHAMEDREIPKRHLILEINRSVTTLCYLLGIALMIFFFFKILYEKYYV